MRVKKDPQWLVLCDVTWGQRSNQQICCLGYNYLSKTDRNMKFAGLVCLSMFLHCTNRLFAHPWEFSKSVGIRRRK